MSAGFVPDLAMLRSVEVVGAIVPIGEEVTDLAKDLAPKRTEHLANSIHGGLVEKDGKIVYRVQADDFKARWIEFGTVNMDAEPFLGPAAMAKVGNLH